MFTVALDYGFTGANIYEDYDVGLMLYKDNQYGIFSYDDDSMVLELSKKYTSIEYDSNMHLVKLGIYDSKNKLNYYAYYNLKNSLFKLDVSKLESVNNSKKIYYIKDFNIQGKIVYMLFNSNGEALKDIPYVTSLDEIELITENTLVTKNGDDFNIYDLNGNFIEASQYVQSGLKVIKTTNSYYLALNNDNELLVTNHIGKTIVKEIEVYRKDQHNYEEMERIVNYTCEGAMDLLHKEVEMTPNQYQIMCYFFADLSTAAIRLLTGEKQANIYKIKQRLKRKLETEQPQHLQLFLRYLSR